MAAGFTTRKLADALGDVFGLFWLNDTSAPTTTTSIPAHVIVTTAGVDAVGEVQATPTSNTILGRLKAMWDQLVLLVAAATDTNDVNIRGPSCAIVQVTPTITASSAYSTGQTLGGKMTFAGMSRSGLSTPILTGILQDVTLGCKTAQTFSMDVFIFNADPTNSTITDKTAFVLHALDIGKVVDVISIASTDWVAGNVASFCKARGLASEYVTTAGNLYAAIVLRSAPTLGSTSDIVLTLKGMPD